MTNDDLLTLKTAIEAQGLPVSGAEMVRFAHAKGIPLSKNTAVRWLHSLCDAPAAPASLDAQSAPAAPDTAPPPDGARTLETAPEIHSHTSSADPVALARVMVDDAEAELAGCRLAMDDAVHVLWLAQGVMIDGQRYGGYAPDDPVRDEVRQHALVAQQDYRLAVQRWSDARARLSRQEQVYIRSKQEQWVAHHQPQLVDQLTYWRGKLSRAPSDRASAEAKKNVQEATFAYERAVAVAPVGEA